MDGMEGCYACMLADECQDVDQPERTWQGVCAYTGMNAQDDGLSFMSHLTKEGTDEGGPIMDYWGTCPIAGGLPHEGRRLEGGTVCTDCGMRRGSDVLPGQIEMVGMPKPANREEA